MTYRTCLGCIFNVDHYCQIVPFPPTLQKFHIPRICISTSCLQPWVSVTIGYVTVRSGHLHRCCFGQLGTAAFHFRVSGFKAGSTLTSAS